MRDSLGFHICPLVFSFLLSFLLLCQAELQRSCSQRDRGGGGCQLLCSCRTYPLLPPPPPPPPPPRGLGSIAAEAPAPLLRPWWMEIIVVGTTGGALTAFLLLTVIICYKAIKRKPLEEKPGSSVGEDTTSSFTKNTNAAV